MGNKLVTFTDQQLENYQDCTFFTRKEILRSGGMWFLAVDTSDWWFTTDADLFILVSSRCVTEKLTFETSHRERVFKRFREVRPDIVPKQMKKNEAISIRIPLEDSIEKIPELHVVPQGSVKMENPFKKRICEVFSRDGKGNLSFEDFLDLLSVFSEQAPRDIKVFYAFRIYDFDSDQHIGPEDIDQALVLLTRNTQELTSEDRQQIAEKVVEEADVDGDGKLSYMEFEHVITRAPEFLSTFHIRI